MPAPTKSTVVGTYTTYSETQPLVNTITFNMDVTGVNPGDVPVLVTGGELDYTLPTTGAGTLPLPQLTAFCQQILSITPAAQAVSNAGNSASYSITITNPTGNTETFVPYVVGIPASWGVTMPASFNVGAGLQAPSTSSSPPPSMPA